MAGTAADNAVASGIIQAGEQAGAEGVVNADELAVSATEGLVQQPIYVLGRQVDTAVAKDWEDRSVLDVPDWTLAKNDAWIQNIINTRGTVYLGSPQTQATLWNAGRGEPTIFARDLAQLRAAGYTQVGDYMYPLVK